MRKVFFAILVVLFSAHAFASPADEDRSTAAIRAQVLVPLEIKTFPDYRRFSRAHIGSPAQLRLAITPGDSERVRFQVYRKERHDRPEVLLATGVYVRARDQVLLFDEKEVLVPAHEHPLLKPTATTTTQPGFGAAS